MSRLSALAFVLLISTTLSAQSKKELKDQNLQLKAEIKALNEQLVAERQKSAVLEGKLSVYKEKFEETDAANTQLQKTLNAQSAYHVEAASNAEVDSVYAMMLAEFSRQEQGGMNHTADVEFSRNYLGNCLNLRALEILFSEEINLDYTRLANGQLYGVLKNRYYPDYGKVEYHVQRFTGVIEEKTNGYDLIITQIDGQACHLKLQHRKGTRQKGKVVPVKGAHLFYTKKLKLADLEVGEC